MWIYSSFAALLWSINYILVERLGSRITMAQYYVLCSLVQLPVSAVLMWRESNNSNGMFTFCNNLPLLGLIAACIFIGTAAEYVSLLSIQKAGAFVAASIEITYPILIVIILLATGVGSITPREILAGLIIVFGVWLLVSK